METGGSRVDAVGIPPTKISIPIFKASEIILEEIPIGRGGYGTVYRGKHKDLGSVAVKTLVEHGLLPQKHTKILKKEAKNLLELSKHSSILKIYGLIMEKDNYSLVLEYMTLGSLLEFRKEFSVEWPLMVRITWDVVFGMEFLHSLDPKVLHLDLKADNILLNRQLRAKIADFGLSEWRTATMTVTRGTEGSGRRCTVSHVPPEVWSNVNLAANSQYDVFSFGIVIWEMLTGGVPYGKSTDDLVRSAVLSGQRPDFSQIPKECPAELTKMMTRCWHQKPAQRPSFSDLKEEIDKLYIDKFQKLIIQSLKNIRAQIVEDYESDDPVYIETSELDNLPDPVEMEVESEITTESVSVPESSESPNPSAGSQLTSNRPQNRSDKESDEDDTSIPDVPLEVKFYKKIKDMTNAERQINKVLHNVVAMRLAKTKAVRDIFNVSQDVQKVLKNPKKIERFIDQDLALKWEMKYFKCDIYHELSGIHLESNAQRAKAFIDLHQDDMDRPTWGREVPQDQYYYRKHPEIEIPEREKRQKRIKDIMYRNHLFKNSRSEGDMYRVKKALENASQLQQALKDREQGGGSSLKLLTIEPEVLDLCKDPYLLIPCLYNHESILDVLVRSHKDLFLKLVSNAKDTGSHQRSRPSTKSHSSSQHRERDMMRMDEMMMMAMDMDRYGPPGRMRSMYDDEDYDRMMMHRMYRGMRDNMRRRDKDERRMSRQSSQTSSSDNKPLNTSSPTSSDPSRSSTNSSSNTSTATSSNTSSSSSSASSTSSASGSGFLGSLKNMFGGSKEKPHTAKQDKSTKKMDKVTDVDKQQETAMDKDSVRDLDKRKKSMDKVRDFNRQKKLMMNTPEMPNIRDTENMMNPMKKPDRNISSMMSRPAAVTHSKVEPTSSVKPTTVSSSYLADSEDIETDAGPSLETHSKPISLSSNEHLSSTTSVHPMDVDQIPSTTVPSGASHTGSASRPQQLAGETSQKQSMETAGNLETGSSEQQVRLHHRPQSSNKTPPPSEAKKQKTGDLSLEADAFPRPDTQSSRTSKKKDRKDETHTLKHEHGDGATTSIQWSGSSKANIQVGTRNKMIINNNPTTARIRKKRKDRIQVDESELSYSMEEVSDKHFDTVASMIEEDWKYLAWEVDTPKATLQQIEMDYKDEGVYEMTYQVLKAWHKRIGREASLGHFSHLLHKIGRDDIAILMKPLP